MKRNPRRSTAALISFVRKKSPFYREHYRKLPKKLTSIQELPVIEQSEFWAANSLEKNRLLTGPMKDGLVLKSGGTTGKPKFSVFSRQEWAVFTATFAKYLAKSALKKGDRVANLFYVGDLYGSFLFTHKVLEECPTPTLQLPIAGITPTDSIIKTIYEYEATVLAGLPTTLMSVLAAIEEATRGKGLYAIENFKVRLILFAGEPLTPSQRARVLHVFPKAKIQSIGYASNDAGLLGYTDHSCGPNEFRTYDGHTLYEIIDEQTGQPITQPGIEGISVVTALQRSLMPILRYPAGDRAQWVEPPGAKNRKFLLLGRSDEGARIASLTVRYDDIGQLLEKFSSRLKNLQFQLVVERKKGRDGLTVRLSTATQASVRRACKKRILKSILEFHPIYKKFVDEGKINPVVLEWREPGHLELNPRTGKLKRILDLRLKSI